MSRGGGDEDNKPNTGDQGAHINLKVKARGSESHLKYEKMQGNDEEDELEEEDEDGHRDTYVEHVEKTTLQMNSGSAVIYVRGGYMGSA
nr:hypothetical protein [Tanacetum cinerariifolium]